MNLKFRRPSHVDASGTVATGFVAFPVADDPKAAIGLRALSETEAARIKGWASRMNLPFDDD